MSTSPDAFAALPFDVLSDARISAERQRARTLGFSAGYAAGAKEAARELAEQSRAVAEQGVAQRAQDREVLVAAAAAFAAATRAAQARELPVLDAAREHLCRLAFDLAKSLVGAVDGQPSAVPGVSFGALSALLRAATASGPVARLTVAMAPAQAAQVNDNWDLVAPLLGEANATVVADASLSSGSAVANYPHGHVDATLERAFGRAQLALTNALTASNMTPFSGTDSDALQPEQTR